MRILHVTCKLCIRQVSKLYNDDYTPESFVVSVGWNPLPSLVGDIVPMIERKNSRVRYWCNGIDNPKTQKGT